MYLDLCVKRKKESNQDDICRQRELRKNSIKNYIEQQFNWANKVMPTGEEVRAKVSQLPDLPDWSVSTLSPPRARDPFSVEYTERVQSFFPTCECKIVLCNYPS